MVPTLLVLLALFVCSIAGFNVLLFDGDFGEGMIYGLAVIGGFGCLVYAVAKYYS